MECRANGVKYGLSIVRVTKSYVLLDDVQPLRAFCRHPSESGLQEIHWPALVPLPLGRRHSISAPCAFCLTHPIPLIMTSRKLWLVRVMMLPLKMLCPRIVEVHHL